MKRFKDMTGTELGVLKRNAKDIELSPFAKFHIKNRGVTFQTNSGVGTLDKWEAFNWDLK